MLRDDFIKAARLIAKIDSLEDGSQMDDDAVLNEIARLADENDRLERELSDGKKRYADAFFNAPREDEKDDAEVAEKEIVVEDFLDL